MLIVLKYVGCCGEVSFADVLRSGLYIEIVAEYATAGNVERGGQFSLSYRRTAVRLYTNCIGDVRSAIAALRPSDCAEEFLLGGAYPYNNSLFLHCNNSKMCVIIGYKKVELFTSFLISYVGLRLPLPR